MKTVLSSAGERIAIEQNHYRLLVDWIIRYEDDGTHYEEVTVHPTQRIATIRPPRAGVDLGNYFRHEVLHVAFAAMNRADDRYAAEEMLVQDIVKVGCTNWPVAR